MRMKKNSKPVSGPSLRRLPTYLHLLEELQAQGVALVSCPTLAERLGLDPTQVRKDIAMTGLPGRPKVGYETPLLIQAIRGYLHWDRLSGAVLVGAGNLGRALMGYGGFAQHGITIIAAFDDDAKLAGSVIHGKTVYNLSKLKAMLQESEVAIGIITVPAAVAQNVADQLVASGIRAIWNFAPVRLQVTENVVVVNEDLSSSLAVLCRLLGKP